MAKRRSRGRRRRRQNQPGNSVTDVSRRHFLKTAATFVGISLLYATIGDQTSKDWGFLSEPFYTDNKGKKTRREVQQSGVRYGLEEMLHPDSPAFKELSDKLIPRAFYNLRKNYSMPKDVDFDIDYNLQRKYFAMPSSKELADQVIAYAKIALEFMYDRVPNLTRIDPDWTPVQRGQDFSTSFDGKAIIGSQYYEWVTMNVAVKGNHKLTVKLETNFVRHGAQAMIYEGGQSHIFLPTSPYALVGPFSEIIPFSFLDVGEKLMERYGVEERNRLAEGASEAMQIRLVRKLIDEIGIPCGHRIHREIMNAVQKNDIYKRIPAFDKYLERNSMENLVEIYQSGDTKFFDRMIKEAA